MAVALATTVWLPAARAQSAREVIPILANDVVARVEVDTTLGQYYTVAYRLPAGMRPERVERAVLELYLDARARWRDGYVNEAPVVEVCALKEPYSGALDARELDLATSSSRPIATGRDRRVVLDITRIVRANLAGTLRNQGLVVGSVTGMREGDFALVSGKLPSGRVAQIRVYGRVERR